MSDGAALLAAILAQPDDDTPRLVYADWLQEQGEEEWAVCIRDMILRPDWYADRSWIESSTIPYPPEYLRALDWLKRGGADRVLFGVLGGLCRGSDGEYVWHRETNDGDRGPIRVTWSRGFIAEVTCTASDWLVHAGRLVWHPGQTLPCLEKIDPKRGVRSGCGPGERALVFDPKQLHKDCSACKGTCRVPRTCPLNAHPVTRVTLTTPIHRTSIGLSMTGIVMLLDQTSGYQYGGITGGLERQVKRLLRERWPKVSFVLPEVTA